MIRLDDLTPAYDKSRSFCRLSGYSRRRSVGIWSHKLLDWRSLERRTHQLLEMSTAANLFFWGEIRRVAPDASRACEAWICQAEGTIIKYNGEGYSLDNASDAADRLVRTKSRLDDFVLVPSSIGGHIGGLRRRSEKLHAFFQVYQRAFHRAIEDRLRVQLDAEFEKTKYHKEQTFLVRNEDRVYPVTVDYRGQFTFVPGDVTEAA